MYSGVVCEGARKALPFRYQNVPYETTISLNHTPYTAVYGL